MMRFFRFTLPSLSKKPENGTAFTLIANKFFLGRGCNLQNRAFDQICQFGYIAIFHNKGGGKQEVIAKFSVSGAAHWITN